MYKKEDFKNYYFSFLGVNNIDNNSINICASALRCKPTNQYFYYPVIVSYFDNYIIVSIQPKYFKELKVILYKNNKNIKNIASILNDFFKTKIEKFQIKTMLRMVKLDDSKINTAGSLILDNSLKECFMNTGNKANNKEFKEKKWQEISRLIDLERYYVYPIENKIASICFISNINFFGGNIVVLTQTKYRNRGYAKSTVSKAIGWCFANKILPIYYVEQNNINSLKLAKSLNFKEMAKEIVVCYNKYF
jgi:hypothetical protein